MPRLTLLTFPQRWNGAGELEIRVLALPAGDPFASLDGAAAPPFASTDLSLQALLVPNLAVLPKAADALKPMPLILDPAPLRSALFTALATRFKIAPSPPPPAVPPQMRVRKHLPQTYQEAAGISQSRYSFAATDDSYHCALEGERPPAPAVPPPDDPMSWGQVLAYLLRQPRLLEKLGMLFATTITPPDGALLKGGWLFTNLQPGSAYSGLPSPSVVASYAARIPPLAGDKRPVFAAMLFPVDSPGGNYDQVFPEAEDYDDGFAKIVHTAQPVSSGLVDTQPAALPPVRDLGIRLGWDDEQIGAWMNRQLGIDPLRGNPIANGARMGVFGYRLDVRDPNDPLAQWASLNEVQGPSRIDGMDLGTFQGELGVEAIPVSLQAKEDGDYWLPPYFAVWAGGSVVLSDPDSFRLARLDGGGTKQIFEPVGADLPLLYGNEYEFRVRLMDLSSGGPRWDEPFVNPAPAPVSRIRFRRYLPPKGVEVSGGGVAADGRTADFQIGRPRLGYPAAVFTPYANALAELEADRDNQSADLAANGENARLREVGIPDPDVEAVEIVVFVRALAGDNSATNGFVKLFTTQRLFDPNDIYAPLDLSFAFLDISNIAAMPLPGDAGPINLPAARELRVELTAIAKADDNLLYFGNAGARRGSVIVPLAFRASAQHEVQLLVPDSPANQFQAIFLQPEEPPNPNRLAQRALAGHPMEVQQDNAQLLAQQLGLNVSGLTFSGKPGRRTVFGCSSALRHVISPDRAAITFGAKSDLALHWIIAIRVQLNRDWTWDGLSSPGFEFVREGHGAVGTISLPRSVNGSALQGADRAHTDLVFFDAIDPKPEPPGHPEELNEKYTLHAFWRSPQTDGSDTWNWPVRLPVAARPVQTLKLISAGLASSPYQTGDRYSSSNIRSRRLWFEFDRPPDDPQDKYYARVLAYAPDPLLMSPYDDRIADPNEPELPLPPERIRVITCGQAADENGLDSMQELERARDNGLQYLLPLPKGLDETALELFGFFVYELRVGHDSSRWCLTHARHGPPLRVTGVQHPAPPLICQAGRTRDSIEVAAPFATPVLNGRILRPTSPRTDLWALLYAQVRQIDGASWRNVLLARKKLTRPPADLNRDHLHGANVLDFGTGRFDQTEVVRTLQVLGLPVDSPLSVLTVEVIGEPFAGSERPMADPLGKFLGEVRILRTSPLTPLQEICIQP